MTKKNNRPEALEKIDARYASLKKNLTQLLDIDPKDEDKEELIEEISGDIVEIVKIDLLMEMQESITKAIDQI